MMMIFFFLTPISRYFESLDVIPGLLKSRGALSEEEFRGKQFIPKWPVLFLISEFYKEIRRISRCCEEDILCPVFSHHCSLLNACFTVSLKYILLP